jgi:hypothetical protein
MAATTSTNNPSGPSDSAAQAFMFADPDEEVSLDLSPTPVWFCLVYVPGTKPPEQAVVPGTHPGVSDQLSTIRIAQRRN